MTQFVINPRTLEAAAEAISTEETRYYLNSVRLKAEPNDTKLRYEVTNGHLLIRALADHLIDGELLSAPVDAIVLTSAVKRIVAYAKANKSPLPNNIVATVAEGRIRMVDVMNSNDVVVDTKLVDATNPDTDRVIPNLEPTRSIPTEYGFNLDYIAKIAKAMKLQNGTKTAAAKMLLNSDPSSPCRFESRDFLAVLMPMRL